MNAGEAMSFESELDDPLPEESSAEAAGEPWSEDFARRFGWIVMVLAPLVAYANAFQVPFVFDGFNYIVEKQWIGDIWTGEKDKVETFFKEAQTRPLVYLSFACDYQTSRLLTTKFPSLAPSPTGHYLPLWHLTNLAIHITAGLTLYGIARHGFRSPNLGGRYRNSAERIALTAALLWVVHPLDTQSITYLYQRHESLMGMFYFLALYLFTRYAASGIGDDAVPTFGTFVRRWGWAFLSIGACLCGMGSKEVMITAPLVILWYDRVFVARSDRTWAAWFLRRTRNSIARTLRFRKLMRKVVKSPWFELAHYRGLYHVGTFATLKFLFYLLSFTLPDYAKAGILDTSRITPQEYALSQVGVVRRYMQLSVAPVGLNIDYAWRKPATWPSSDKFPYIDSWPTKVDWPAIVFPAIFVGGLGFLTLIAIFRSPALGFLGGTFFLILAPTSSIAPIIDMCFEHRMYIPLASILTLEIVLADIGIAKILSFLGRRRPALSDPALQATVKALLVVIIATTFTMLTLRRNYDYRSQTAIWDDAQQKAPKNERAKYNHGVYLQIEGTTESMDRAIEQYFETLKLDPNYSSAHLNLANIFLYRSRLPGYIPIEQLTAARHHYEELLRLDPTHSAGRYGLADTLYEAKEFENARIKLEELLRDEPNNGDAEKLLKKVMAELEKPRPTPSGTGATKGPESSASSTGSLSRPEPNAT